MRTKQLPSLKGLKILIISTGSIAAVKTPLLVSNLIKLGVEIKCVVTPSASKLVSALSLSTLSRNRCFQNEDQWDPKRTKPLHIDLAEWADLLLVAPLSASTLSRWVHGLAEGLAASILLAFEKPIIAAAAMNTGMWNNQSVKNNWKLLKNYQNVLTLKPEAGLLACDRIGEGRMANEEIIQFAIEHALWQSKQSVKLNQDLQGLNFLVTTGPTIEDIDATRFLSNRSSGKMGICLGQAARFRGATVDLIHGPLSTSSCFLEGLKNHEIRSGADMQKRIAELQANANAIVMCSAIVDLRKKKKVQNIKISKDSLLRSINDSFELVPDLLKELTAKEKNQQVVLGFSALTGSQEEIKKIGMSKKDSKGCDLLLANPIDKANQGFESNFNSGWLLGPQNNIKEFPVTTKLVLANQLLDEIKALLNNPFETK